MKATAERVFVYGTLRRGASNHFRMRGAGFVAEGTVGGRIYRIDWYPGLVLDREGERVLGEVYDVSPQTLSDLDEFEGVSSTENAGEYRRVRAEITCGSGEVINAWVWEWLGEMGDAERIVGGNWLAGGP